MKITIIVLNWNGKDLLKTCLDSIYKQSYRDFELIVSDNGSTDGSIELVKKRYPKARLIENKTNLGFAEGNNVAIRQARGEFIILLNNDTSLEENAIFELLTVAEADKKIGMVSPKMILAKTKKIDTLGHLLFKSGLSWDCKNESKIDKIVSSCAGAALYRKDALEDIKINGEYFDSDFFIYSEDLDLGLRLRLNGWKYAYAPKAIVHHLHAATSKRIPNKTIYYSQRNNLWVIMKDVPTGLILRNLAWILLGQIGGICIYTLRKHPILILKAKLAALAGVAKILKKRKFIMKKKVLPDKEFGKLIYPKIFREKSL